MKFISIQTKILSLIILTVIIVTLFVLFFSISNQKENLLSATIKTLSINTEMLNNTIRNVMIAGEAPIAVSTMKDIRDIKEFKEIEIYRTDGTKAFHNFTTLENVNKNLEELGLNKKFGEDPSTRVPNSMIKNPNFQKVLKTPIPISEEIFDEETMETFFPIINRPECRMCHGTDHFIRGIAHFKVSLSSIYNQINSATLILSFMFLISSIGIGSILILFLRKIVLQPMVLIGNTVNKVGEGNFEVRVTIKSHDEFADLGGKINNMIKSVEERIKLSKYVSKSTEDIVMRGGETHHEGEKRNITVLFSDIRGFTAYSEGHDPETVIKNLNVILEVEAEIIEKFGGDVDKFVGDEVMAVFKDELSAVMCAAEMIKTVKKLEEENKSSLLIGIGINSGEVVAGHIGSKNRTEFAVIGDTVNLASRLCSKAPANGILISEGTNKQLTGKINSQLIPNQQLKGKAGLLNIYAVRSIKDNY